MNDGANSRKPAGKFNAGFDTRSSAVAGAALELHVERRQILIELIEAPRADDRRRHAGLRLHPGERDSRRRRAELAGDANELVDDRVVPFGQRRRDALAAIGRRRAFSRVYLPVSTPPRERRPRRHAEAELPRHRHQVAFDRPLDERVLDLNAPITGVQP